MPPISCISWGLASCPEKEKDEPGQGLCYLGASLEPLRCGVHPGGHVPDMAIEHSHGEEAQWEVANAR